MEADSSACRATASICRLAHDLIEHRTARLVGLGHVVDCFEHGRTVPTGAPTPAHDQTCCGLSILLRKVRPFTSPRRGPSTGSDHCCAKGSHLPRTASRHRGLRRNSVRLRRERGHWCTFFTAEIGAPSDCPLTNRRRSQRFTNRPSESFDVASCAGLGWSGTLGVGGEGGRGCGGTYDRGARACC
jgi:hypothetical protein